MATYQRDALEERMRGRSEPAEESRRVRITIEVAADETDAVLPWRYTVELARPPAGLLLHN